MAYAEFRKDSRAPSTAAARLASTRRDSQVGPSILFLLKRVADLEDALPDISEAQRGLDVVLLHRLMLEKGLGITAEAVTAEKNVSYEREMDAALARLIGARRRPPFCSILFRVQQVADVALGGDVMPQKSTDFYPKLMSGIAIYRLEGRIEG